MSLTVLYSETMKIDSWNIGPFLVLFLLSEIFDSTILDLFFFKEYLTKKKKNHSQVSGSNSDDLE